MNEIDVLKKIASTLTERKSSAALSNYRVLCSNIAYVNHALSAAIGRLRLLQADGARSLSNDTFLNSPYRAGMDLDAFVPVVNRLQLNTFSIFDKLAGLTAPDDRRHIGLDNVTILSRGFYHYNDLVTGTRQYIDSVVSDSYQLVLLDPKALNYHVLVSLNSFSRYATKSLSHALFNAEVTSALAEFRAIPFRDWTRSHITECNHLKFGQKVDYLFSILGAPSDLNLPEDIKDIFKFSSEFTHIGYISTFFTATAGGEVILGDDDGPYLPSTENFSELKYEILTTVCKALVELYVPSLSKCFRTLLITAEAEKYAAVAHEIANDLTKALASRNSTYFFFVKDGLVGSAESIPLTCMCGRTRALPPPHNAAELFCESCGSVFKLLAIKGAGGYVLTSSGPVKIIGADVPDFCDLPEEEQINLLKKCESVISR